MGYQILTTLNLIQKFASLKLPWTITPQLNHSLLNISLTVTFTGVLAFSLYFAYAWKARNDGVLLILLYVVKK